MICLHEVSVINVIVINAFTLAIELVYTPVNYELCFMRVRINAVKPGFYPLWQ